MLFYSQAVYKTKIAELEALIEQLNTHYENLSEYRTQMFTFWDDQIARDTADVLEKTMLKVRCATQRATNMLNFHSGQVDRMDNTGEAVTGYVSEALELITGLDV